jgi:hypothetical protein
MMVDVIQEFSRARRRATYIQRFNAPRKWNLVHCHKLALLVDNRLPDFNKIRRRVVLCSLVLMKVALLKRLVHSIVTFVIVPWML